MTREEAVKIIDCYDLGFYDLSGEKIPAEKLAEAFYMATEALKHERTDEWCADCKEYDTEKKCCPRFNKVIREALKREPSEDGTQSVSFENDTKIKSCSKDSDLISRQDAIETVGDWMIKEFGYLDINRGERLIDALEARPSANRPRGEWINTAPSDRSDNIICDQCGYNSIAKYVYCPNCGADMRSE